VVAARERRKTVRHSTRLHTSCLVIKAAEEGTWLTRIRNVSAKGIGLICQRSFKVGTLLTLEWPAIPPMIGKTRLVRVKNVRAQPGNHVWIVGGSFLSKLSPVELQALK
jgi:hypothetical protein